MERTEVLSERFEAARPRLLRIAQRMLGSAAESDDALQESWLRVSRADVSGVENFDGWLTTVVARVCLDALKWRESRREEMTPDDPRRNVVGTGSGERPEDEAVLAESIGLALLVLLDALPPAERVAYVLHDMFDVPFDTIAAIVGKSAEAARQLASRARRRVRGASPERDEGSRGSGELVRAFLAASRAGHFADLIALLDPAATFRADAAVVAMGGADAELRGADAVARMFSGRARAAQPALLDGEPGAVWMHEGAVRVAFRFAVENGRIAGIELVADKDVLERTVIS